jgi:Zn-finger nucleic acid-binding protein
LELQTEDYENVETLFCGQCWGHWMSKDAFTTILQSDRYKFSDAEKESVLRQWANKADSGTLDPILKCPICGQLTVKKPFSDDCPVVLDLCHDHGVWLDASEIKQVQVYFDGLK